MEQLCFPWMDFDEIWYWSVFFRKSVEKVKVSLKCEKNIGYFTWRPIYLQFLSYLAQFFLEWKMSQREFVEKIWTHFMISNFFFENPTAYYLMWKNTVELERPQMTIWRMRISYWITKATDTHSEYVIIIAFPLQQWLHERVSMLLYTYIACLC
jgi:hypothetical protein